MDISILPETRRQILLLLKRHGPAGSAELAARLGMTAEAVRQQLAAMAREGWVRRARRPGSGRGRPAFRYELTPAGEHLFPKAYDALTVELVDAVGRQLGDAALHRLLATLAEERVRRWEDRVAGLPLRERLAVLREWYMADDPFMEIEEDERGLRLVEHNCPFLNVARDRPALCSVTVWTLSRLLGVRVVREERFQDGDGRCAFRVLPGQPVDPDEPFRLEA